MPSGQIHEAVQYMRATIEQDNKAKVYVHCKAGRGRSATIVVAYLWKYGNGGQKFNTMKETYAFVKSLRPQINLNEGQMRALDAYAHDHPRN
jgi:protein-tyrosine phosphatase